MSNRENFILIEENHQQNATELNSIENVKALSKNNSLIMPINLREIENFNLNKCFNNQLENENENSNLKIIPTKKLIKQLEINFKKSNNKEFILVNENAEISQLSAIVTVDGYYSPTKTEANKLRNKSCNNIIKKKRIMRLDDVKPKAHSKPPQKY